MVWLFSRNLRPWSFLPFARTGMRVKTRELRRSLLVCVSGIVIYIVQCGRLARQSRDRRSVPKEADRKNVLHSQRLGYYVQAVVRGEVAAHFPAPAGGAGDLRLRDREPEWN